MTQLGIVPTVLLLISPLVMGFLIWFFTRNRPPKGYQPLQIDVDCVVFWQGYTTAARLAQCLGFAVKALGDNVPQWTPERILKGLHHLPINVKEANAWKAGDMWVAGLTEVGVGGVVAAIHVGQNLGALSYEIGHALCFRLGDMVDVDPFPKGSPVQLAEVAYRKMVADTQ